MWPEWKKDQATSQHEVTPSIPITNDDEQTILEGESPQEQTQPIEVPVEWPDERDEAFEITKKPRVLSTLSQEERAVAIQKELDADPDLKLNDVCEKHYLRPSNFYAVRSRMWPHRFGKKEVRSGWPGSAEKLAHINQVEKMHKRSGDKTLVEICDSLNSTYAKYIRWKRELVEEGVIKPVSVAEVVQKALSQKRKKGRPVKMDREKYDEPKFLDVKLKEENEYEDLLEIIKPKAEKIYEFKGNRAQLKTFCKTITDLLDEESIA